MVSKPVPWENKTDNRLLWRGQISGIYHLDVFPWRLGQRDRLSFFAYHIDPYENDEILVDRGSQFGVVKEEWPRYALAEKYLDVGVVNEVSSAA